MSERKHDAFGRTTIKVDLGGGREGPATLGSADLISVALAGGLTRTDIWINDATYMIDLRVIIERIGDCLNIRVDRGDEHQRWWPAQNAPQLSITINRPQRIATALACAGASQEFHQMLLGQTKI